MAKILLVEDDISLREIYAARLQAEGHTVVAASDGEEALAVVVKDKPDLVICDVMMPKISGFDVLDILRSTPETKHAKIIMMTALSQQSDRERGERLGADKYLVKSQVTLEDVVNTVTELLGQSEAAADNVVANNVQSTAGGAQAPTASPIRTSNRQVLNKEDTTVDDNTTDNNVPRPAPAADAPSESPMPEPGTSAAPAPADDTSSPAAPSPSDDSSMPATPAPSAAPADDAPISSDLEVTEPDTPADDEPSPVIPIPSEPPAEPPTPEEPESPAAPASNPQNPQPGETIMPGGSDDNKPDDISL